MTKILRVVVQHISSHGEMPIFLICISSCDEILHTNQMYRLAVLVLSFIATVTADCHQQNDVYHGVIHHESCKPHPPSPHLSEWKHWGIDLDNTRHQSDSNINPRTISGLVELWRFTAAGNVATTISSIDGIAYIPDAGGYVYAVRVRSGQHLWTVYLPSLLNIPGAFSRTTPIINGDHLYLGSTTPGSPVMFSLNRHTGALEWVSPKLDSHIAAQITMSGTYNPRDRTILIGVSSDEEALSANASYPCCSFRGSVAVVSAESGTILCQTYLTPILPNGTVPFPGVAVWGSSPPIDYHRNAFYIGTGNNYIVPEVLENCVTAAVNGCAGNSSCAAAAIAVCTALYDSPANHLNSIMAFDLNTCAIKWNTRVDQYDAWTVACIRNPGNPNCPAIPGPDADFGQCPILTTLMNGTDVAVIGQKSGIIWTLNRDNGAIIHANQVAPGGTTGGIQWGMSKIGRLIYAASANSDNVNTTLPNGTVINYGSVIAYSPDYNGIFWEVPEPIDIPGASHLEGAVSTGPGLVYVTSVSGNAYAFHAKTGQLLWSVNPHGNSIASGITVLDEVVLFGTGYRQQNVTSEAPVVVAYGLRL